MRIFALVLICLAGYLSYDIYFGKNGIEQYNAVQERLNKLQGVTSYLRRESLAQQDEIKDLQEGNLAVEELARSELGLVKPGESFYRVVESK